MAVTDIFLEIAKHFVVGEGERGRGRRRKTKKEMDDANLFEDLFFNRLML